MPLQKSCSLDAFKANVAELIRSGKPRDQAVAIAHSTLRESCKSAGKPTPRTDSADLQVQRYDFSRIGNAKRTPQGFLKFDARPTRVGVLQYRLADGSIRRELRPSDEVFRPDSLETLAGAPLTDLHVTEVTPQNVSSVAKGRLSEDISHDSKFVQAHVIAQDSGLIEKIDRGERKELSAGYRCRLEFQPGTFDGEQYDAVQRDIIYNHVAIGPEGWGRAGSEVALRLDGDDAAAFDTYVSNMIHDQYNENFTSGSDANGSQGGRMPKRVLKIDGVDYAVEAEDSLFQAFDKWVAKRDQIEKDLGAQVVELESRADSDKKASDLAKSELQAKFDSQSKDLEATKKELAEAKDPKRLDERANERAGLFAQAQSVLGIEEKLDGLKDREIKEKVLLKLDPEFKFDGLDDGYVNGAFLYAMKKHTEKRADGTAASRAGSIAKPPSGRTDQNDESARYDAARAQREMIERETNAWKTPQN